MPLPPPQQQHKLVIEFMERGDWLGGSIYIDNLLATLSVLPVNARPSVRVRFLSSPSTPLAKRLFIYPVIEQRRSHHNQVEDLAAFMRRFYDGMVKRWPWIGIFPSSSQNELFFPCFDARKFWRKNLYWIPDFQHHHLPELFDSAEIFMRTRSYNEIASSQGILLLSSNAALADFRRFYPDATVKPRVWSFCSSVDPGTAEACDQVINRFSLPKKFLYIANQFWRHKDHSTAFEALRILREKGIKIPTVCTGLQHDRRYPNYFEDLVKTLDRQGLQDNIRFLGVIPRQDQIQVFRAAAAVLQPSRFEGWSTVIEDAKALGRPIIASDIDVHREQLSGVSKAHLFRTTDPEDLSQLISTVWPDLQSGPIFASETIAGEQRDERRLDAAYKFVAIIDEAITHP